MLKDVDDKLQKESLLVLAEVDTFSRANG